MIVVGNDETRGALDECFAQLEGFVETGEGKWLPLRIAWERVHGAWRWPGGLR